MGIPNRNGGGRVKREVVAAQSGSLNRFVLTRL